MTTSSQPLTHTPVLKETVITYLVQNPNGIYVDATMGAAGHTQAILNALGTRGKLLAMDVSPHATHHVPPDPRIRYVRHNFRYLIFFLEYLKWIPVDGILADLGVTLSHYYQPQMGFTFHQTAPLDLRLDPDLPKTAQQFLKTASEQTLQKIFEEYGDLYPAKRLARAIIEARQQQPIITTTDLVAILQPYARGKRKRFFARVFQALRIAINDEFTALTDLIQQAERILRIHGRLLILTYHSGEDRIIRHYLKTSQHLIAHPDSPITPSPQEITTNPHARSARLHILEKIR